MKSKVKRGAKRITLEEWDAEGKRRFGADQMKWRFVCPSCDHVASSEDYKNAGASSDSVAFSCVGRWLESPKEAFRGEGGPCNYAGGGLFRINPVLVVLQDGTERNIFEFADAPVVAQ